MRKNSVNWLALIVAMVSLTTMASIIKLNHKISSIDHANAALIVCFKNPAYIGGTQEDTFKLMAQCVDDYERMKGWR